MTKTNRIKNTAPTIKTRAQADAALCQIVEITLKRNAIQIELDEKITALKELIGPDLTECNELLEQKTELIRAWAEANPGEFPTGIKSLDTTHAVIGWRTGTPTLKTLSGWTWDRVLEKITFLHEMWGGYIRTKQEVNKQAILADRDTIPAEALRDIGVKITQEESFFIDPKLTETENKLTTQAA